MNAAELDAALLHARTHFDDHLALVRRFVGQPSISATGEGMAEMATLVRDEIVSLGGEAQIIPTAGWPIVLGELDAGQPRTLLVYGMYDEQPVDGETWRVPPFAGEIVELDGAGPSLVSRGIYNSKGPLCGVLAALRSILGSGSRLPVNVKLVIEGEEELASRSLPAFLEAHRERLRADATFAPFYTQDRRGTSVLKLGSKGVLFFELHCHGGDWGGPTQNAIHGAEGAWIASPVWKLLSVLRSLVDDEERITVPGLTATVQGPSAEDERLLSALEGRFDPDVILAQQRVRRFKHDERGVGLLRRFLFDPILNIDGLQAGHTGAGTKALLPDHAFAKLNLRLVPGMQIDACKRAIDDHVARASAGAVEVRWGSGYPCARTSVDANVIRAFLDAARGCGVEVDVWPTMAGSGPACLFNQILGQDFLLGGLGHGGRQHAPDEYATVEGMKLHEQAVIRLLQAFAR